MRAPRHRARAIPVATALHQRYRCVVDYRDELLQVLGPGFALERELEGAGASQVFVAVERALGRRVVVKMLPKNLANGVNVERFQREIEVAARLQHPHLVPLLRAGVIGSAGLPWFSMPYVEGESLRELLTRRGALPVLTAARLMREIAAALSYAHGRGVVHRDIKPENILLSDGVAMITDFGVAMAVSTAIDAYSGGRRRLTAAGATLGTPAYSAPEQISSAGMVDHRADVYSLGCVAYELLSGSSPFAGRNLRDVLYAQINERPAPLDHLRPGLPPAIVSVVMRCLEKDPELRPQAANEIVAVIDGLTLTSLSETGENPAVTSERLRVTTAAAVPVGASPARESRPGRSHPLLIALALSLAALAAIVAFVVLR